MDVKEYIPRDAALDAVRKSKSHFTDRLEAVDAISNIPAADVRPVVRGHWERTLWFVTCSVCEYTSADMDDEGSAISLNFCPNCGADMREES